MREEFGWMIMWCVIAMSIATAILGSTHITYEAEVKFVQAGLQECQGIGSAQLLWQKECKK